jgi:hypothetical protein
MRNKLLFGMFYVQPAVLQQGTTAQASLRACLDPKFQPQILLYKKKIPITSKYRHMHEVLNVDEIKN